MQPKSPTNVVDLNVADVYAPWLSVKDLSKRYRVTTTTIWNWTREKRLPRPHSLSSQTMRWHIDDILEHDQKVREGEAAKRITRKSDARL
jgi:predicted DNA-binding transcriptional regulator AlpA